MQQVWPHIRNEKSIAILDFDYPSFPESSTPTWDLFCHDDGDLPHAAAALKRREEEHAEQGNHVACEARLAEESRLSFESGRAVGFEDGRNSEHQALAATLKANDAARIEQAAHLLESFNENRDRYFEEVEHEVVKLALAVAARVLRREAQMDPLLLTGAVRVALGQIAATTKVRLRVPAADLQLWTDTMAHLPNVPVKPVVVAGEGMRTGECVMETELGSVDLGVRAQLGEIERGFFDRAGSAAPFDPSTANPEREARG